MKNDYIIVLVTTKDRPQAKKIATALLEDKLIACANMVGSINSIFNWKGKIDQSKEVLLVLKTKKSLFNKIAKKVKSLHSYETPEIIALPILMGDAAYLSWIKQETV